MATAALLGYNAGFKYGAGPTTHQLAVPLRFESARQVKWRSAVDSLDKANREVVTIGSAVEEAVIVIRYDNEPGPLKDMLTAGMDGTTLDYYPDLSDTGTKYEMLVVEVEVDVQPDPDTHKARGEWMAKVRVRATGSTTDFDAILT